MRFSVLTRFNEPRRCRGWAVTENRRCRMYKDLNADGYCRHHRARTAADPVCQGTIVGSNVPCPNMPKPGYQYCRAAHDPTIPYYSTDLFRSDVLTRNYWEDDVVARYNNKDIYHHDPLDLTIPNWIEMDHIAEKQLFSCAFKFLDFQDREEKKQVTAIVRDEVVNEVENLGLTLKTTNRIKGSASFWFLDDLITGHVGHRGYGTTFVDYMVSERFNNKRLERDTTRTISQEMGSALKICQYKIADQGETPILDALAAELQELYVAMELRSNSRRY